MKFILNFLCAAAVSLFATNGLAQTVNFQPNKRYQTENLIITQISENTFVHTSFLQTTDFGKVGCNGLIVSNSNEAIVFDTPANSESSVELIQWIKEKLNCRIKAIVPTHFHADCLAGLSQFHQENIPSYAYFQTVELAKENNLTVPKQRFKSQLSLKVGKEKVTVKFFGEGHTKDNVIAYFPSEAILFGGCLVKEINASKGFLGDANLNEWSATVANIKKEYPNAKIIVPGHGAYGDTALLDYTIGLFKLP